MANLPPINLAHLFLERAAFSAEKPALITVKKGGQQTVQNWKYYGRTALKIAQCLNAQNIGKSDFVAIIPLNMANSFATIWGIILAGAIPVPINPHLVKESDLVDVKKILTDCQPKLTLVSHALRDYTWNIPHQTIEAIVCEALTSEYGQGNQDLARLTAVDTLIMPYTSGTSGDPKGVLLTHRNIFDRTKAINQTLEISEQERMLSYLPLGHIAELIATFFGQLHKGYTVFFTEHAPDAILDKDGFKRNFQSILQSVRPTIFLAVPKIWTNLRTQIQIGLAKAPAPYRLLPTSIRRHLVKKRLGFANTRIFISAGSKLDSVDKTFFNEILGIDILDIYGMTETAGPLLLNGRSIGSSHEIFILENGEIIVRGDCVMAGYYNKPKHALGNFLHTGDTGIVQDEKLLITGRIDDEEKHPTGEKINTAKREAVEKKIRDIDPRIVEVITTAVNQPHLIAYVFSADANNENSDLNKKIKLGLAQIGESIYRPRSFALIDVNELEQTPTFKVKRRKMIKKLENTKTTKVSA